MKINVIGGGPAGLYFSILMNCDGSGHDISIFERNRADDTFGFGVVFSDETLGHFRDVDAPSYDRIIRNFAYWDEIETRYRGHSIRSMGHGFCGMSRMQLLNILQDRAEALGVKIHYECDIADTEDYRDADLVLAADGVNSSTRERYKDSFGPQVSYRPNRFVWLGTTLPLDAFTFIFKEDKHGIWNVHAYQYQADTATWIMETTEETWRAAGMDQASEEETAAFAADLFADDLKGHEMLINRSNWRAFPQVHCDGWIHENVVLLGDAAHTAHYSIGSGTKLAMEDAIALKDALAATDNDVAAAFQHYEGEHRDEVERIQHSANTSLVWFENVRRFWEMPPDQFNFSLMSRSKQITYDNLRRRDPDLVDRVDRWFAGQVRDNGFEIDANALPPPMFTPFRLRDMVLQNRVVVSPMCQYSAEDGLVNDWHLVHLGGRAIGGAGLVYTEMTDVSREARISPGCAGMYTPEHRDAWRRVVDFVHLNSAAKICLQLGHAGRKGSTQLLWQEPDKPLATSNWDIVSASPLPYFRESQTPSELSRQDMDRIVADFVQAARWGEEAGFDMCEIHLAHGYLLASFVSPLTNQRNDEYGGDIEARMRYPLEVFDAVRAVWPEGKPLAARISATDWKDGGLSEEDLGAAAAMLKDHGCDLIDVSAGQTVADQEPVYGRMFQTPYSDQIRNDVGIATMAVGNITTADQVNTIVAAGRADLVALARPHLGDPHFTLRAAAQYGYVPQHWPDQYLSAREQLYVMSERANEEMAELRELAKPRKPQQELADGEA